MNNKKNNNILSYQTHIGLRRQIVAGK